MGFSRKVLKALNSQIAPVRARMFNLSLQNAQVPEDWRRAIVILVVKSPRTTDPRQFRPISLASVVCKILETILKESCCLTYPNVRYCQQGSMASSLVDRP